MTRKDINWTHEIWKSYEPWKLRWWRVNYANSSIVADGWDTVYQNFIG